MSNRRIGKNIYKMFTGRQAWDAFHRRKRNLVDNDVESQRRKRESLEKEFDSASRIEMLISQGRDLEEGEKIDLADGPPQDGPGLVEQWLRGKLRSPGVRQHASYLAELQGYDPDDEGSIS